MVLLASATPSLTAPLWQRETGREGKSQLGMESNCQSWTGSSAMSSPLPVRALLWRSSSGLEGNERASGKQQTSWQQGPGSSLPGPLRI